MESKLCDIRSFDLLYYEFRNLQSYNCILRNYLSPSFVFSGRVEGWKIGGVEDFFKRSGDERRTVFIDSRSALMYTFQGFSELENVHKVASRSNFRNMLMLPLPSLLFGFLLSTFYGAVFHLWRGGGAGRLLFYLLAGWLGFWGGHFLAEQIGWNFVSIGPLHTGLATLMSLVFLFVGHWLSLVDSGTKK